MFYPQLCLKPQAVTEWWKKTIKTNFKIETKIFKRFKLSLCGVYVCSNVPFVMLLSSNLHCRFYNGPKGRRNFVPNYCIFFISLRISSFCKMRRPRLPHIPFFSGITYNAADSEWNNFFVHFVYKIYFDVYSIFIDNGSKMGWMWKMLIRLACASHNNKF